MSNSSSSSSGVGFFGLLTVLFIGLKLTNVITWSWWLVMLPLYGPVALGLVVVIIGIGIAVISSKQGD
jgi:hypothetical protein